MKRCTKCGKEKDESEFGKNTRSKDGLQWHCKQCNNEMRKIYRENNKKKIYESNKKYKKKYRENHKKQISEYWKTYYKENEEKIKKYHKKYYKENEEKIKEYGKKYNKKNREKKREYYENNKEKCIDWCTEYRLICKIIKQNELGGEVNEFDIKPWKDPESLFCDTGFLENMLGKEITKGKECK